MIETDIQIRFSDLDVLGHVNNVILQQYFDQGKQLYFRNVVGIVELWREKGFSTASTTTSYSVEVRVLDNIEVRTRVEMIGVKSLTFLQQIVDKDSGVLKCESRSVLVGFDLNKRESIELLPEWREKIIEHEREELIYKKR